MSRKPKVKSTKPKAAKSRAGKSPPKKTPARRPRKPAGTSPSKRGLARRIAKWSLVLAIWAMLGLGALIAYYAYDLPDVSKIAVLEGRPSITLLGRDGIILASHGDLYGEALRVAEMPVHLPHAVVAVEDRRFYQHGGMDFWGLARAIVRNVQAGRVVQGGSTITQQLAKNLFLSPDRTLKRKVQEMLLAFWLERTFTKDEILTLYLNRVYLGAGTYGVDAAARRYFGKPATEVTLYEAALLAGLLKAPSRLNPVNDAGSADARAEIVLEAMVAADFITEAEAKRAYSAKTAAKAPQGKRARYFSDWLLNRVRDFIGAQRQDLVVETTLDSNLQAIAQSALAEALTTSGQARRVGQGALVILSPRGAVRAMVGGRDYQASQFNRATQALRQPGSAFKAFVYLAAFEAGLRPDSKVLDAPITIADWSPKNYDDRYAGEVTLREAFARSLNTAAVRLSQRVGRDRVASMARRLGITSELVPDASIALGTSEVTLLELTSAYAAIANGGYGVLPYGIVEVRTTAGQVLYRRSEAGAGRLLSKPAVASATEVMRATLEWGTGKAARIGRPAAGKTGTSQDFRDAWFIGFTESLVAGVWFGNDDGRAMQGVTGGGLPAQTWAKVMTRALQGVEPRALPGQRMTIPPETAIAEGGESGEGGFISRILDSLGGGDGAPARGGEEDNRFLGESGADR